MAPRKGKNANFGKGTKAKFTPSGKVSANARRAAQKKHHTMPDGSFPIDNLSDLAKAKHDVGRAKNPAAARRWINKRAKELGGRPLGVTKASRKK